MEWKPFSLEELKTLLAKELASTDPTLRAFYDDVACTPIKWQLHPWGDRGGGFWVVAVHGSHVLWFNDIEEGFNVSRFEREGVIAEYGCNQDEVPWALAHLRSATAGTADT